MAQVFPFRAYRFNPELAPFDRVLTQPYDKISPERQAEYYAMHPQNLIAVEKSRIFPDDSAKNKVYPRAEAKMDGWIQGHIILQDPAPGFYAYTQEFTVPGTTEKHTRRGLIGAGRLEEYSAGVIFRHEHTLSGPKADRLEPLRPTRMHAGQPFILYSVPQQHVERILNE